MRCEYHEDDYTIKKLQTGKYSYIRLGDGEIRILCGHGTGISFQRSNDKLRSKLKEMIDELNENNYKDLIICTNKYQDKKSWYLDYFRKNVITKELNNTVVMHNYLSHLLSNKTVVYVSSYINKLVDYKVNIEDINYKDLLYTTDPNNIEVRKIKTMYSRYNRKKINDLIDVILINIKKLDKNIFTDCKLNIYYEFTKILHSIKLIKLKNDLDQYFSRSKAKKLILINCQYRNNFDQYTELFETVKSYCKDDNVLTFGCGPAGKIMILELKKLGIKNLCFDYGQNIL